MNHPISSWLRKGAISLALVGLAGPSLASRTVTSSDTGNGSRSAVASSILNTCDRGDFIWAAADACSGFFANGEDAAVVQALVGVYDGARPAQAWSGGPTRVDSQISGATSTTSLFTTSAGNSIAGEITFQQTLSGSFVIVLSGTWRPVFDSPNRQAWSAYYLFDDVIANISTFGIGGKRMEFVLFGEDAPVDDPATPKIDAYVMNDLTVGKVSIYQFDVTRTATVPEPSSLLLSGLALVALGAAGALARRRRLPAGSAPAL